MKNELASEGLNFKVECSRCGDIIRHTSSKNSKRLCLKCYARMLNEHMRNLVRPEASREGSER